MRYKTDLHVHSVLSGCADVDNSVPNLINMGALLGLRIMAIADHNAVLNVPAAVELGKSVGVLVVPAMEVTTAEEIHVLCLFPDYDAARAIADKVNGCLPRYALNTEFYNRQRVTDSEDGTLYDVDYLLSVACGMDVYALFEAVEAVGGVAVPAHVDKDMNGMIAVLGVIPDDLGVTAVEVSSSCDEALATDLAQRFTVIRSSDAHSLEAMCENEFSIELTDMTVSCLLDTLKRAKP